MRLLTIVLILQSLIAQSCLGAKLGELLNQDSELKSLIQRFHSYSPGELKAAFNDLDQFCVRSNAQAADVVHVINKYVSNQAGRIQPPNDLSKLEPPLLVLAGELLLALDRLVTKSIPDCSVASSDVIEIMINAAARCNRVGKFVQQNARRHVERCFPDHWKNVQQAQVGMNALDRIYKMVSKIFEVEHERQVELSPLQFLDWLQQLNWSAEDSPKVGEAIYETLLELGDGELKDALLYADERVIHKSYNKLLVDSCQSIDHAVDRHGFILLQDLRISSQLVERVDARSINLAGLSIKCSWFLREHDNTFQTLMDYVRKLYESLVV